MLGIDSGRMGRGTRTLEGFGGGVDVGVCEEELMDAGVLLFSMRIC